MLTVPYILMYDSGGGGGCEEGERGGYTPCWLSDGKLFFLSFAQEVGCQTALLCKACFFLSSSAPDLPICIIN